MNKALTYGGEKLNIRTPMPLYCPGCHHPLGSKAICDAIEELGLVGQTIAVWGVGCCCMGMATVNLDTISTAHGRALDVATGIKRALRSKPLVFAVMGDGDCLAIGAEALFNTAARAEKVTGIMMNNSNYGTTGGQMAPTTVVGQVTSTTPQGRDPSVAGYPVHAPEWLAPWTGVAYTARGAVNTPANFQKTKTYLKKAFQKQMEGAGFTFVEIISACPTDWHLSPIESLGFIENTLLKEYPLGEFKGGSAR